jgi:hypothetical protein
MLILIEFNELCPPLLRDFIGRGLLPHFRRFSETSAIYTTDAGEEPPHLEPWIQWPTVHSGMTFSEHGVFHLGDGRKLGRKCLAELLSDAGVPDWLQPFYRVVSQHEHPSSPGFTGGPADSPSQHGQSSAASQRRGEPCSSNRGGVHCPG